MKGQVSFEAFSEVWPTLGKAYSIDPLILDCLGRPIPSTRSIGWIAGLWARARKRSASGLNIRAWEHLRNFIRFSHLRSGCNSLHRQVPQSSVTTWFRRSLLPQGDQVRKQIQNWLCGAGNSVAKAADKLGNASGKLQLAGLGAAGVGFVAAQPELITAGLAVAATGGAGNILAGVGQFSAGLLQGAGGGGFSNSGYAALSLATGFTLARGIAGPAVSGYRTVSQRGADAFAQGTANVAGGVNNAFTSLFDSMTPQQVDCSGGN